MSEPDFAFSIVEALDTAPVIRIVDVGAMDIGHDTVWQPLADAGLAQVVGFEPVAAECEKLNANAIPGMRFLPYAIGDGTERPLYVTRYSACTSLYEPNRPFLALFQDLPDLFEVVETPRVVTRRMDDIVELADSGCDFLKLDIQGGEREALAHAGRLLERTQVVHTEVCFAPLYRQAPMIGEIDALLRANGFMTLQMVGGGGRTLKPDAFAAAQGGFMSQILWCDMVYVKDYTDPVTQTADDWIRLAVIVHELYRARDLAWIALSHADRLAGTQHAVSYRNAYEAAAQRAADFNAQRAPNRGSSETASGWLARLLRR